MNEIMKWGEQSYQMPNSFKPDPLSSFGSIDKDGFIHITNDQFLQLRSNVPGSFGEYLNSSKNMFTRCGIMTNHLVSSHSSISSTTPNFDGVHILSKILSSTYLLQHIREEGGAYGVGSSHDNQKVLFSSYDDPNIQRTIDHFIEGGKWIREQSYTSRDIQEARLSLFSDIDSPVVPQSLGYADVFIGKTKEKRQAQRDILLTISEEELHQVAQKAYQIQEDRLTTCVFGNTESMKEVENKSNWIVDELPLE